MEEKRSVKDLRRQMKAWRMEKMRGEHFAEVQIGNAAKFQEWKRLTNQVLSDLLREEFKNSELRHEFQREYSTSTRVSHIICLLCYFIPLFKKNFLLKCIDSILQHLYFSFVVTI